MCAIQSSLEEEQWREVGPCAKHLHDLLPVDGTAVSARELIEQAPACQHFIKAKQR